MSERLQWYCVIDIDRIGRHRKGDEVKLPVREATNDAAAEAIRKFARNYLVSPHFGVTLWLDDTFGIGHGDELEQYGGGKWRLEELPLMDLPRASTLPRAERPESGERRAPTPRVKGGMSRVQLLDALTEAGYTGPRSFTAGRLQEILDEQLAKNTPAPSEEVTA